MKKGSAFDEDGELIDVNKVQTALASVGVSLLDAQGQFRDFDDVIFELADKWDTLDKNSQRYVATIAAGNRQQSRFIALVSNGKRLREVADAADNSEDAGLLQYSKTLDSLETKLTNLKTSFQQFYMNILNGDFFKGIIDKVTLLIDSFNKLGTTSGMIALVSLVKGAKSITGSKGILGEQTGLLSLFSKNGKTTTAVPVASGQGVQAAGQVAPKFSAAGGIIGGIGGAGAQALSAYYTSQDNINAAAWANTAGSALTGLSMGSMFGPVGMLLGAVGGGIAGIISNFDSLINGELVNAQARIDTAQKNLENTKIKRAESTTKNKNLLSYEKKLTDLQKERFSSSDKQEEWISLNNEIIEQYPELLKAYDLEGNALVDLGKLQQQITDSKKESLELTRQEHEEQVGIYEQQRELYANSTVSTGYESWSRLTSTDTADNSMRGVAAKNMAMLESALNGGWWAEIKKNMKNSIQNSMATIGIDDSTWDYSWFGDGYDNWEQDYLTGINEVNAAFYRRADAYAKSAQYQESLADPETGKRAGLFSRLVTWDKNNGDAGLSNSVLYQLMQTQGWTSQDLLTAAQLQKSNGLSVEDVLNDSKSDLLNSTAAVLRDFDYFVEKDGEYTLSTKAGRDLTKLDNLASLGTSIIAEQYAAQAAANAILVNNATDQRTAQSFSPINTLLNNRSQRIFDGQTDLSTSRKDYTEPMVEAIAAYNSWLESLDPKQAQQAASIAENLRDYNLSSMLSALQELGLDASNDIAADYATAWQAEAVNVQSRAANNLMGNTGVRSQVGTYEEWLQNQEAGYQDDTYENRQRYLKQLQEKLQESVFSDNELASIILNSDLNTLDAFNTAYTELDTRANDVTSSELSRKIANNAKDVLTNLQYEYSSIDANGQRNGTIFGINLAELNDTAYNALQDVIYSDSYGTSDWEAEVKAWGRKYGKEDQVTEALERYSEIAYDNFVTASSAIYDNLTSSQEELDDYAKKQDSGFTFEEAEKLQKKLESAGLDKSFGELFEVDEDGLLVLTNFSEAMMALKGKDKDSLAKAANVYGTLQKYFEQNEKALQGFVNASTEDITAQLGIYNNAFRWGLDKSEIDSLANQIAAVSDQGEEAVRSVIESYAEKYQLGMEWVETMMSESSKTDALKKFQKKKITAYDKFQATLTLSKTGRNTTVNDVKDYLKTVDATAAQIEATDAYLNEAVGANDGTLVDELGRFNTSEWGQAQWQGLFHAMGYEEEKAMQLAQEYYNNSIQEQIRAFEDSGTSLGENIGQRLASGKKIESYDISQAFSEEDYNRLVEKFNESIYADAFSFEDLFDGTLLTLSDRENGLHYGPDGNSYASRAAILSKIFGKDNEEELEAFIKNYDTALSDSIAEETNNLLDLQLSSLTFENLTSTEAMQLSAAQKAGKTFIDHVSNWASRSIQERLDAISTTLENYQGSGQLTEEEQFTKFSESFATIIEKTYQTELKDAYNSAIQPLEEGSTSISAADLATLGTRLFGQKKAANILNYVTQLSDGTFAILNDVFADKDLKLQGGELAALKERYTSTLLDNVSSSMEDIADAFARDRSKLKPTDIQDFFKSVGQEISYQDASMYLNESTQTMLNRMAEALRTAGIPENDVSKKLAELQALVLDAIIETISSVAGNISEGIEGTLSAENYNALRQQYGLSGLGSTISGKGVTLGLKDQQDLITSTYRTALANGLGGADTAQVLWDELRGSKGLFSNYQEVQDEAKKAQEAYAKQQRALEIHNRFREQNRAALDEQAEKLLANPYQSTIIDKQLEGITQQKDAIDAAAAAEEEAANNAKIWAQALSQVASIAILDPDDPIFNFMDQEVAGGLTKNFDNFVSSIDSVKSSFDSLKAAGKDGYIGYQDFYNMMDFLDNATERFQVRGEELPAGLAKFQEALNASGKTYEQFVNSVVENTDKYGKVNIGGIAAEMGISVEAAMSMMKEGMVDGLKDVAKQQIQYLSGLEKMLEALAALEAIGSIGADFSFKFDVDGDGVEDVVQITDFWENYQKLKDDQIKQAEYVLAFRTALEGAGESGQALIDALWGDGNFSSFDALLVNSLANGLAEGTLDLNAVLPQLTNLLQGNATTLAEGLWAAVNSKHSFDDIFTYDESGNINGIQTGMEEYAQQVINTMLGIATDPNTYSNLKESDTLAFTEAAQKGIAAALTDEQGKATGGYEIDIPSKAKIHYQVSSDSDSYYTVESLGDFNPNTAEGKAKIIEALNSVLNLKGQEVDVDQNITVDPNGKLIFSTKNMTADTEDIQATIATISSDIHSLVETINGEPIQFQISSDEAVTALTSVNDILSTIISNAQGLANIATVLADIAAKAGNAESQLDKVAGELKEIAGRTSDIGSGLQLNINNDSLSTLTTALAYLNSQEAPKITFDADGDKVKEVAEEVKKYIASVDTSHSTIFNAYVGNVASVVNKVSQLISSVKTNIPISFSGSVRISKTSGDITTAVTDGGQRTATTKFTGNVDGKALVNGQTYGAAVAGKTLVGELGPELAVYDNKYHLLGKDGAEFVDLPSDAIVFNHLQTQGIIDGKVDKIRGTQLNAAYQHATMYTGNALIEGNAFASGIGSALSAVRRAKSVWQGLLNSLSIADLTNGGGGGGGGGGKNASLKPYIADLQEWYNLSRQIVDLENRINALVAQRNNLSKGFDQGAAYLRNLKESQALLEDQLNTQRDLYRYQQDELKRQADAINDSSNWISKFYKVGADGVLQYVEGNETNGGKGALEVLQELNEMGDNPERYTIKDQVAWIEEVTNGQFKRGFTWEEGQTEDENGKTVGNGEYTKKEWTDEEYVQEFFSALQEPIDDYDGLRDSVQETEEKLESLAEEIQKVNDEIRDNEIEVSQMIYDAIVQVKEKVIKDLKESNKLITDANKAYADSIQDAITKEKNQYSNNQNIAERETLQRQLSLLRRSGGSASEIQNLEKTISEKLKDEYFQKQEDALEVIKDANTKQTELMEQQVQLLQDTLDYEKENGVLWTKVYEIMDQGNAFMLDFLSGAGADSFLEKANLEQKKMLEEWAFKIGLYSENERSTMLSNKYAEPAFDTLKANTSDTSKWKEGYKDVYDSVDAATRIGWDRDYLDTYNSYMLKNVNGQSSDEQIAAAQKEASRLAEQSFFEHIAQEKKRRNDNEKARNQTNNNSGGSSGGFSGGSSSSSKSSSGSGSNRKVTMISGETVTVSYADAKKLAAEGLTKNGTGTRTSAKADDKKTTVGRARINSIQKKIRGYSTGGMNSETGLAMLHGTPQNPEYILNANQTRGLEQLVSFTQKNPDFVNVLKAHYDSFAGNLASQNYTTSNSNSIIISDGAIQISVAKLNDSYDIEDISNDIMDRMYSIAAKSSSRSVSRR